MKKYQQEASNCNLFFSLSALDGRIEMIQMLIPLGLEAVALAARAYAASRGRDLKVVIMGYTRLNFVVGEGVQPVGTGWGPFKNQYGVSRGFWESMGCPSMAQLDEAYLGLDARLKDFANGKASHVAHAKDVVADLQAALALAQVLVGVDFAGGVVSAAVGF